MSNKPNFAGRLQGKGNGRITPPVAQQNVNINDLPQIDCNCGNNTFVVGMQLRYANRLVSQNGQPTVVQVPQGWVCTNCGAPNDFAYRPELSEIMQKPTDYDPPQADEYKEN